MKRLESFTAKQRIKVEFYLASPDHAFAGFVNFVPP